MNIKPEKISITPEMKRSMAETKAEMDKWMEDQSFRAELDALEAECKAQDYSGFSRTDTGRFRP